MSTSFQSNRPIVVDSELPAQTTATNGSALISNGTTVQWKKVTDMIGTNAGQATPTQVLNMVLPTQLNNAGKVLHTDGTNITWVMEPVGYTGSIGYTGSAGYIGSASTVIGYTGSTGAIGYTGSNGVNIIPASSTSITISTADVGKCVIADAGITIPASVFAQGDVISIYNNTASNIVITQGAGLTLRLCGTTTTGSRTILPYGVATVWFVSPTVAVALGQGLT